MDSAEHRDTERHTLDVYTPSFQLGLGELADVLHERARTLRERARTLRERVEARSAS